MKVLILTQWYPPEPAFLIQEFAQTLIEHRHHVTVLTGFPNYPSGKIYSGYRLKFLQKEVLAGVTIVRVPLYPEHSRSGFKRALNYLSFSLSAGVLGFFGVPKPDVLFVYHPPLTIGIPAFVISRLWRIPFVYQIQDMWPETLSATGMMQNATALKVIAHLAKWVYSKAAAICVISPGFRDNLVKKGVPADKVHVISNWANLDAYVADPDPVLAEELGLSKRFNVMFAGNIGEAQGLEVVIEAAKSLRDLENFQFVLVGDGVAVPALKNMASAHCLTNVVFLGRFSQDRMPALYALADVLLVHLKDDPLFRITIPHKTLSYLASGKPILSAIAGDTARVVVEAGAGFECQPGNSAELARAVRKLYHLDKCQLRSMGINGRKAAGDLYSREHLVGKIEAVMHALI